MLVKAGIWRDDFLESVSLEQWSVLMRAYMKMFHSFDVFLRGLGGLWVWVVEFVASSKVSNNFSMLNGVNVSPNPLGSLLGIVASSAVLDFPN